MINGYPYHSSVFPGTNLLLCVSSDTARFKVKFCRQGTSLVQLTTQFFSGGQPFEPAADGIDWGWKQYSFAIPANWQPGVYIAIFVEVNSAGREINPTSSLVSYAAHSKALFVVKNPNPGQRTCILYKVPLFTWQAYNAGNGSQGNLYSPFTPKVSLRRPGGGTGGVPWDNAPFPDPQDALSPRQTFEHWDAKFISWMEAAGYIVDYCTDLDIHLNEGKFLSQYHLVISVGHDEYWSKEMRNHLEAYVQAGGNVTFFSGNTCFWQVRLEGDSILVCYKSPSDPISASDSTRITVRWSEPLLARPENKVTGTSYVNGGGWWAFNKPSVGYVVQHAGHWVFAGTGLADGNVLGGQDFLVGYEADGALVQLAANGYYEATGTDGTSQNFLVLGYAFLNGWEHESDLGNGLTATMGIYSSRGIVFNVATTDWARVLGTNPTVDRITRNVLDKLRSRSVRIIGPSTKVCGKSIAVQGGKANFTVDTSAFAPGQKLNITWNVTGGTVTGPINTQIIEVRFPNNNFPVHISVTVDDGTTCPGFGTLTLRAVDAATYSLLQLICKLSHMVEVNVLLLGSRNRFRHFVDPLWDPLRGDLSIRLTPKQVKAMQKDVGQLGKIVAGLGKGLGKKGG